jgi:hypothetical protein
MTSTTLLFRTAVREGGDDGNELERRVMSRDDAHKQGCNTRSCNFGSPSAYSCTTVEVRVP